MNAVPLGPKPKTTTNLDDLITEYGAIRILLAVLARPFKRSRPPDIRPYVKGKGGRELDLLPDNVRRDIGLEPKAKAGPSSLYHGVWGKDLFY